METKNTFQILNRENQVHILSNLLDLKTRLQLREENLLAYTSYVFSSYIPSPHIDLLLFIFLQ
jgi:hypothetical protein